jgi:hypothetical protein
MAVAVGHQRTQICLADSLPYVKVVVDPTSATVKVLANIHQVVVVVAVRTLGTGAGEYLEMVDVGQTRVEVEDHA